MVGIFGGSGFYQLIEGMHLRTVDTPYGEPSGQFALGEVEGVPVAFLPRHGVKHNLPPAAINYRANLWAMRELGVERIIAPTAAGSLQSHVHPGDLVICDQLVDRTMGRRDTFYPEGPSVVHVSLADPYCSELRQLGIDLGHELELPVIDRGTAVVIQGPRFSTRAESRWFSSHGWEVIGMTQYPEVALARELELCYMNISLITDYDAGVEGEPGSAVSVAEVEKVFVDNLERLRRMILRMIPRIPSGRGCACSKALQEAVVSG
ncbi:MAG: S-methyl-5'-thioadenosine phosphorylase [Candidatus Dormibacteraceae bacterium]